MFFIFIRIIFVSILTMLLMACVKIVYDDPGEIAHERYEEENRVGLKFFALGKAISKAVNQTHIIALQDKNGLNESVKYKVRVYSKDKNEDNKNNDNYHDHYQHRHGDRSHHFDKEKYKYKIVEVAMVNRYPAATHDGIGLALDEKAVKGFNVRYLAGPPAVAVYSLSEPNNYCEFVYTESPSLSFPPSVNDTNRPCEFVSY